MDSQYIIDLCKRSHEHALAKGFVEEGKVWPFYRDYNLFLSETAEALEDYRAGKKIDETWYEMNGDAGSTVPTGWKPCGIPSELSDVVIRICQRCGTEGSAEKLATEIARADFESVLVSEDFEEFLAWVNARLSTAFVHYSKHRGINEFSTICLAEAVFMIFSFCTNKGIDLKAAITEKEAYNRTRPYKHGGKKL